MVFRMARLRLHRLLNRKSLIALSVLSLLLVVYRHYSMVTLNSAIHKEISKQLETSDDLEMTEVASANQDVKAPRACRLPQLDIKDPLMMKFYEKLPSIKCTSETNWVYVKNGTVRFSEKALLAHHPFSCSYYPLIRGPGDYNFSYGPAIENIPDGQPVVSTFFKIACKGVHNSKYENIHAGVPVNKTIRERLDTVKPPRNGLGLSIALLGFDSMSRMSWLRRLPKSREFMTRDLGTIELEGYNIMGDGTPAALLPILTGKHEQELPEARRKFKGAKTVDGHPWIWKEFAKHGYVTSWADAMINIAPFNYRMLGFEHSPTDFFMRPFYLAVDPTYKNYTKGCHGSLPQHQVWFNFVRDIFHMYKNDPKFLIHFYTPLSHDNNNRITMADEDFKSFLSDLHTGGFLNNTVLVVMADHGARFAKVRGTLSGKLEERMPYMSFTFPPWFEKAHPDIMKNFRTNVGRLTTPMDIHETFKDFLRFDGSGLGSLKKRGISLFKEIPVSRTCAHADVESHWCACMEWTKVNPHDKDATRALAFAVQTINNFTRNYRSDCAMLSLGEVTMTSKSSVNDKVLRFKETTGDRGLEPILSDDKTSREHVVYQLTFYTEPGHGHFEVTLEHKLKTDVMSISPKAISRINKYGSDPDCILDRNREIRQYCYCKNNLKS